MRNRDEILHDRYRIIECIGRGAMGAVYLVEDLRLPHARWALKELDLTKVNPKDHTATLEMFKREAALLGCLHHPGLPRLIDAHTDPNAPIIIVMEFIQGDPLDLILEELKHPLTPWEAIAIALQTTQVLDYLHTQSPPVIFRDLKPSNLMLTSTGHIYVIDFGIARRFSTSKSQDTQKLGTPGFCAPEQYGHGQTTPASDIYSLGTTLYYMLTLKDPQEMNFNFTPISEVQTVPEPLEQTVQKCLKIDPKQRFAKAAEVQKALEHCLETLGPPPAGHTRPLHLGLMQLNPHPAQATRSSKEQLKTYWKELVQKLLLRQRKIPTSESQPNVFNK